jgi:hypothetical protein
LVSKHGFEEERKKAHIPYEETGKLQKDVKKVKLVQKCGFV